MAGTAERLRERIAQDLKAAMKSRDAPRVSALRSLAAALDNATAVPQPARSGPPSHQPAEVPRRMLSDEDVRDLLLREIGERHDAAFALEKHGCMEEALSIRAEVGIIEEYARAALA
jgi:uncharacterized protein